MKKSSYYITLFLLCSHIVLAQNKPSANLDPETRNRVVESTCKALNRNYVFPGKAESMTAYLLEQNKKGKYDQLTNPNDLAGEIQKDIRSVYNDRHIRIEYDPSLEKEILKFVASKEGANKITAADMAKQEKMNFNFKRLEILPSNIGYMEFNGFARPGLSARKTIHAAMQFVAHTDALIIDLRNNYGGNGTTASELVSYFFKTKTYTGRSFNRIENKWTEEFAGNKKDITKGLVLDMPVYILTSHRTFSAAEGLAYTLQTMKNAVIVGDTTRGGAHLTRSFSLGDGFVGFIPFARGENAVTKTDWEGVGVIPDIAVKEADGLAAAQNSILQRKFDAATDAAEKRKIAYIINYNKSRSTPVNITLSDAARFVGRYAEFEVSIQGEQLMLRDTNQPVVSYKKMTAITPTLFQAGNDYQVEFLLENGICHSIKMFWEDGYEDKISKSGK